MAAGSKLALGQEPIVAVAFSAMLLAFSREKLHQTVLAQKDSLSVLGTLLEVLPCLADLISGLFLNTTEYSIKTLSTDIV